MGAVGLPYLEEKAQFQYYLSGYIEKCTLHSALCTMYTHQQYDLNFYVYTSQGNTQEMLVRNLFLCLVELVSEFGVV